MNKNILIGMVGILIVLVVVLIVKIQPKNSDTNKNQSQSLETNQKNTTTATPFVYNSPTPEAPKTYKYGEKATLNNGRYITVFSPIVDYKEGPLAPEGKKYILVESEYSNNGDKKTACSVSLRLGDSKDTFYDSYLSIKSPGVDCRNLEDQSYLQPGKSTRGFITFQVNTDTVVKKIIYQDYEHTDKITFSD